MTTELHKNDCAILAKLFFPDHDSLAFADGNQLTTNDLSTGEKRAVVVLNSSSADFETLPAGAFGLLAFGKKPDLPQLHCLSFDYVNNADGSIRWLYPADLKTPIFLKLYNGAGLRGRVFRLAFRAVFLLGIKNRVKSGTVHIFSPEKNWFSQLTSRFAASSYAIFTGTVGENRKAVVAMKNWFCKIPLTASAAALVTQERKTLEAFRPFSFEKLEVPKTEELGSNLAVSDVKPPQSRSSSSLEPHHLEALLELKQHSYEVLPLGALPLWQASGEQLADLEHTAICNDLPPLTVRQIVGQLKALRQSLDQNRLVPTTLAHGDFTPWNMYLGRDKLHVYDWELAGRQPLLFDAFHFVFQSGILLKRESFPVIKKALSELEKSAEIKALLAGQTVGFRELYNLYLLQNISYYLPRYLRQQPLHVQAHWLVGVWHEALHDEWCLAENCPATGIGKVEKNTKVEQPVASINLL
ncbi:MAG: aminoglycoside phosphotransferase family protein [Saprospiraceae bacterium]|nr:aminoglycoside phosphotransferase family protein [Saprospiraceae bacterium]MCF8249878.1 aminoglycoside phosphotransferase family protein [Saprospiraceae bacterium]MCF8279452.1 aminoglycoside phosphotransferase family protein [Bacteroidales bacterium]MCF8311688.1 aminoglycoside phosphotransferase family protein [Saprospiraceae bacterium]MCF8440255.1 aminoglycoside phosphotransferase family protein [Saprospiraceae bacterium]